MTKWYVTLLEQVSKGLKLLEGAVRSLGGANFGADQEQAGEFAKVMGHISKAVTELDEAKKGVKVYIGKMEEALAASKQGTIDDAIKDNKKTEKKKAAQDTKPNPVAKKPPKTRAQDDKDKKPDGK